VGPCARILKGPPPLFPTQGSSGPPTAMGPRALHALHTLLLHHRMWVNSLLWDSQPGELSLPSLCDQQTSSNPCIYTDYGGGDHLNDRLGLRAAVWLQAKVRVCGLWM